MQQNQFIERVGKGVTSMKEQQLYSALSTSINLGHSLKRKQSEVRLQSEFGKLILPLYGGCWNRLLWP